MNNQLILAIESSCDETCAAVVRGREVISNVVASQVKWHQKFGGVVPEIASRHHLELIDDVIFEALHEALISNPSAELDAVAVTQGPGLVGALLVGIAAAKARAYAWNLPLIPVDHLRGHVASALLAGEAAEFPMRCLLVSGGHSMIIDVDAELNITLLGTTRDDAAGEAFDKGARLLGLPMPGGPSIERAAAAASDHSLEFTPAMVHHKTLDTSFAGIKTALATHRKAHPGSSVELCAAALQTAIVETLAASLHKSLKSSPAKRIALVGGVAANRQLRARIERICADHGAELYAVPLQYCGDNAAMIGVAAQYAGMLHPPGSLLIDAYATSMLFRDYDKLPTHGLRA